MQQSRRHILFLRKECVLNNHKKPTGHAKGKKYSYLAKMFLKALYGLKNNISSFVIL